MKQLPIYLLLMGLSAAIPAHSAEPGHEIDPRNGEEINEVCAGCHGEYGEGGKDGEYPRIAGQPAAFIAMQLELFRSRTRANMPMLPHTEERELPDGDIADVAAYIAGLELVSKLPPIDESLEFDALQRLEDAKRMLNVARVDGDVERGRKIYRKECRSCHGDDGWGNHKQGVPMLAGQYTNYLENQVLKYIAKERIHDAEDPDSEILGEFSGEELRDIFAYLSTVDD